MVTELLKRVARRILRKELGVLKDSLSGFAADNAALAGKNARLMEQRNEAYGRYQEIRVQQGMLKRWAAELADKADGGETQSRMLFLRDMMDHGPNGPYANTNGVHPADRWNVQSFNKYRPKRDR